MLTYTVAPCLKLSALNYHSAEHSKKTRSLNSDRHHSRESQPAQLRLWCVSALFVFLLIGLRPELMTAIKLPSPHQIAKLDLSC